MTRTAGPGEQRLRRRGRQVRVVRGHRLVTAARGHLDPDPARCGDGVRLEHVVGLAQRHDETVQLVVAVRPESLHPERERELGVRRGTNTAKPHAATDERASAAHSSRPRASARAVGATPAAVSTASVAAPKTGCRDRLSILRRCPNPARIEREQLTLRRDVDRGPRRAGPGRRGSTRRWEAAGTPSGALDPRSPPRRGTRCARRRRRSAHRPRARPCARRPHAAPSPGSGRPTGPLRAAA